MIDCLLSVTAYCAISVGLVLTYLFARKPCNDGLINMEKKDYLEIPIRIIIFFAALYTLYNVSCTYGKDISIKGEGDRFVYYLQFIGELNSTAGMTCVLRIIRLFTDNFNVVLYFTTFVCCCMFFLAFNRSSGVTVLSIVFFLLTEMIVGVTFVNLKQSFSVGFAYLALAICLNKEKSIVNEAGVWLLIVAAILFHVTAVILIPIYFLIRFTDWQKKHLYFVVIIFVLCMAFMKSLGLFAADILVKINPYSALAAKLNEYFVDESFTLSKSTFVFIKGAPVYIISIIGIIKRRHLRESIDNYDSYLLLSIFGSVFYLCSARIYWMYRMIYYFYLPISIFIGQIIKKGLKTKLDRFAVWSCYLCEAVVFFRWLILIYINYGGF